MDVAVAVAGGQRLAVLPGLVEVAAVLDQLRPPGLDRLDLDGVGHLGDADHRPDPEPLRRPGDRLAVVAGGGGDHAPGPLGWLEPGQQVDPAADLEGAGRLVVLMLDPHLGAGGPLEQRVPQQRRRRQVRPDGRRGGEDVGEGGGVHGVQRVSV